MCGELVPRALVWATDVDVLPVDREVRRVGDHLVIRSPGNPHHWWGNYLLFDGPPRAGDGERWEAAFAQAFPEHAEAGHRVFCWEGVEGEAGGGGGGVRAAWL